MTDEASWGGRWIPALAFHLLFGALFSMALVYPIERVIHVDSALQFFKWVQDQGISVEAHRYPAVIPQLVVKGCAALGIGLHGLMLVASAMHVLVPWSIAAWLAHGWRMTWLAVGAALAAVLCTRLTFFGMVLEAHYLLSFPFLLAGALLVLVRDPVRRGRGPAAILALAAVLLVHPTGFLVALYVVLFLWSVDQVPFRTAWPFLLIAAGWPLLRPLLLPPTGYEQGLMEAPFQALHQVKGFFSWPSWTFLVDHSWKDSTTYSPAWLLLVVLVGWMARDRHWRPLVLSVLAIAGHVVLNVLTYHTGEIAMMLEKNHLPMATLIAMPLAWLAMRQHPRAGPWAAAVLLVVAFVQVRGIAFAARDFEQRLDRERGLVDRLRQQGLRKAVVDPQEVDELQLGATWALPFEALLLSALDGPEQAVTVVPGYSGPLDADLILPPWNSHLPASHLDARYFQLPQGPYQSLISAAR